MDKSEIHTVLKYVFSFGNTASETAWNINGVFLTNVIGQQTVSKQFAKLHSGSFDLTSKLRAGRDIKGIITN